MDPRNSEIGETPKPLDLKQALKDSAHTIEFVLPESEEIDLGSLGKEMEDILDMTDSDPEHREYAEHIYVASDKKLVVDKKTITGEMPTSKGASVEMTPNATILKQELYLPKHMRQDRVLVGRIHSHPEPYPPSATDLSGLIATRESPSSSMIELVINHYIKYGITKTSDTPQILPEKAQEELQTKSALLKKFIAEKKEEIKTLDRKSRYEIIYGLQMTFLNELVKHYHLNLFSGPIKSNILKKVSP